MLARTANRAIYRRPTVDLSGLPQRGAIVAKWSADSLNLADGAPVRAWADEIGGAVMTPASVAPTFKTNVTGGKPSVRFNGSSQWLSGGRPAVLTAAIDSLKYTVIVICKSNGATSYGPVFNSCDSLTQGASNRFWMLNNGSRAGRLSAGTANCKAVTGANWCVIGCTADTTAGKYLAGSKTTDRQYYQGGAFVDGLLSQSARTTQGENFWMGAIGDGAQKFNGDLDDVIVWNVALGPCDMMQVQKWACDKYKQAYPWEAAPYIFVLDADSLGAGFGATDSGQTPGQVAATALALPDGAWTSTAVFSSTVADLVRRRAEWLGIAALTGKPVRVAMFEYFNTKGTTEPGISTALFAHADFVRASGNYKVALGTSTSSSSDPDANRVSFNTNVTAGYASHADALIDFHNDTRIGAQNSYATNGAGAGLDLWADNVHFKAAGSAIKGAAIAAAIAAIT